MNQRCTRGRKAVRHRIIGPRAGLHAVLYSGLLAALPASAQQAHDVEIYGILDQAIEHVNGMPATGGGTRGAWLMGFGEYASRLGVRGSEALGGGLKAVFALEAGVTVDTGAQGQGRLFGRQAYVGLAGDWGALTFGRQYAVRYYALFDADVYGAGAQGLGAIDPGIPNARVDNAIAWRGGWEAGGSRISAGLNLSLGRDAVAGNNPTATNCPGEATVARACREWSAMLKVEHDVGAGKAGVVAAYERQNGGTAATYGGLSSPDKNDNRTTVNAYYQNDLARFGVGWIKRLNDGIATPRSDLYWVSGALPLASKAYLDGMLASIRYRGSPNAARLSTLRANYLLSRRTVAYLGAAFIRNHGALAIPATSTSPATVAPGGAQHSIDIGIRYGF